MHKNPRNPIKIPEISGQEQEENLDSQLDMWKSYEKKSEGTSEKTIYWNFPLVLSWVLQKVSRFRTAALMYTARGRGERESLTMVEGERGRESFWSFCCEIWGEMSLEGEFEGEIWTENGL